MRVETVCGFGRGVAGTVLTAYVGEIGRRRAEYVVEPAVGAHPVKRAEAVRVVARRTVAVARTEAIPVVPAPLRLLSGRRVSVAVGVRITRAPAKEVERATVIAAAELGRPAGWRERPEKFSASKTDLSACVQGWAQLIVVARRVAQDVGSVGDETGSATLGRVSGVGAVGKSPTEGAPPAVVLDAVLVEERQSSALTAPQQ